jgi:hypothetical protein
MQKREDPTFGGYPQNNSNEWQPKVHQRHKTQIDDVDAAFRPVRAIAW